MKKRQRHPDLRQEILQAAKTLFLNHGYSNTSMRKIAKQVGISATSIYLHYKDKADVIHALHQEGFKVLTAQFEILANVEDPFERLSAFGRCYLKFAIENRGYYEIMFIMKEPLAHILQMKAEDKGWAEGQMAFETLLNTVKDCQAIGYFKKLDPNALALLVWANMHGLCALKNNGHLKLVAERKLDGEVDDADIVQQGFALYVRMLKNYK